MNSGFVAECKRKGFWQVSVYDAALNRWSEYLTLQECDADLLAEFLRRDNYPVIIESPNEWEGSRNE